MSFEVFDTLSRDKLNFSTQKRNIKRKFTFQLKTFCPKYLQGKYGFPLPKQSKTQTKVLAKPPVRIPQQAYK